MESTSTNKAKNNSRAASSKAHIPQNFSSTAIENERKAFERMKAKNEMELIGMVQYELQRELMRKRAEDKVIQQQLKAEKHQKELMKHRKEEEMKKLEKERMQEERQREIELEQKRKDVERYMEDQRKAKEEMKKERQRMKEAMIKHKEEEKRRLDFQMKVNNMLEENRKKVANIVKLRKEDLDK